MPPEYLTHIKKTSAFVILDGDDPDDRALGGAIAELVMNWARLDYALYLILRAKDHSKAADWMRAVLKPHLFGQRIEIVKAELVELAATDEEYGKLLKEAFDKVDSLREKRNLLVHGLWFRHEKNRDEFIISPMQLDGAGELPSPVTMKRSEIRDICREMQTTIERLAHLRGNTKSRAKFGAASPQPEKKASRKS